MFGYVFIACFLGVAASAPYSGAIVDSVSIPKYEFNYAVSDPYTGDNKAQSEVRNGGVVRGSYSLAEPDGTIRVVDYAADPITGFNAKVKRIGTAVHPQTIPVYNKPISNYHLSQPALGYLGYDHGYNWNLGGYLGGWGNPWINNWAYNNGWGHQYK